MSEHNYAGLMFRANLEKNPDLMAFDGTAFEKQQAARRVAEQKANPIKPEPAQQELNKLRGQLFALQQNAKAYEQRVNNLAGNVRLLESQLTTALKSKKEYENADNLLAARNHEHQIQRLENELVDEQEKLVTHRRYNQGAIRELRTWQTENTHRLLELKKQVG
jgi:hypothetical protein